MPRPDDVGENGGSDLGLPAWYWLMPDHSLPSAETGDMVPLRPFMARWDVNVCAPGVVLEPSLSYPFTHRKICWRRDEEPFGLSCRYQKRIAEIKRERLDTKRQLIEGPKRPGIFLVRSSLQRGKERRESRGPVSVSSQKTLMGGKGKTRPQARGQKGQKEKETRKI